MQTPPLALAESSNWQSQHRPPAAGGAGFAALWTAISAGSGNPPDPQAGPRDDPLPSAPESEETGEIPDEDPLTEASETEAPDWMAPGWSTESTGVGRADPSAGSAQIRTQAGEGPRGARSLVQTGAHPVDAAVGRQHVQATESADLTANPTAQDDSALPAPDMPAQTEADPDGPRPAGNDRRDMAATRSNGLSQEAVHPPPPAGPVRPDPSGGLANSDSGLALAPEPATDASAALAPRAVPGKRDGGAAPMPPPSVAQQSVATGTDSPPAALIPGDEALTELTLVSHTQPSATPPASTEPPPQTAGAGRQLLQHLADTPMRPGEPIEVSLAPEELGRVRLTARQTENGVVLIVQAERPETLDLMRRHLPELAQDLRTLGFGDVTYSDGREQQSRQDQPIHRFARQPADPAVAAQQQGPVTGLDLRL